MTSLICRVNKITKECCLCFNEASDLLLEQRKNDRILTYLIINLPLFVSSQDDDQNDSPLSCCSLLLMPQNDWTKAYIRQIA